MEKRKNELVLVGEEKKEKAQLTEMKIEYGDLLEDAFAPVFGIACSGCINKQWGIWCG